MTLTLGASSAWALPDFDGDTFLPPVDCNNLNFNVKPGAVDKPDTSFVDSNCDGIDGDASKAISVAVSGSNAASGTQANPVQTIAKGIELANAAAPKRAAMLHLCNVGRVCADEGLPRRCRAAGTSAGVGGPVLEGVARSGEEALGARRIDRHGRLLPQRTRRVENFLTEHGAVAVMESRIVPLLPYGLVNYSGGLTHLAYRAMLIGTLIGAAPKVFAYTALGGSLDDLTSPEALAALVVLVLLALGGALFVWRQAGGNPWRRGGPGTPPPASARPRG